MQKTDANTVLALIFLASAVVLIGGLIAIPIIEAADAANVVSDSRSKGQRGDVMSDG
jgi:hypothetical protein